MSCRHTELCWQFYNFSSETNRHCLGASASVSHVLDMSHTTLHCLLQLTHTSWKPTYLLANSLHSNLFQICCFQNFLHNTLQHAILTNQTAFDSVTCVSSKAIYQTIIVLLHNFKFFIREIFLLPFTIFNRHNKIQIKHNPLSVAWGPSCNKDYLAFKKILHQ